MPVAALIVVGPGIEVKPIKGDTLRTDGDRGEEGTNVAIEAILVHAEVRRSVAHANEARHQPKWFCKQAHLLRERTSCGRIFDHRRLNLWFRSFRGKLSRVKIMPDSCNDARLGFALFSAEPNQRHAGAALRRRTEFGQKASMAVPS
jgi:hypothetical protein